MGIIPANSEFSIGDPNLDVRKLGVWTIITEKTKSFQIYNPTKSAFDFIYYVYETAPLMWRLVYDIFRVEPVLLSVYLLAQCWDSLDGVVLLHFSGLILAAVSAFLSCAAFDQLVIDRREPT
jgi:hypothetical protein